jgi:hypothetical protein
MDWYKRFKKAVTETTMPYFQEFADQGQYVPDQQSVTNDLQKRFNAQIVQDLGCGDSGCAYRLSNGSVLKITTNEQEGRQAMWLAANSNPFVAEIYDVHKEGDLWYIVMEWIDAAPEDLKKAVQEASAYLDEQGIYDARRAAQALQRWPGLVGPYGRQILSYVSYLASATKPPFDFLNPNNVGQKNGTIKFFDIT